MKNNYQLKEDVKKLYTPNNMCYGDGYYLQSLYSKYGKDDVEEMCKVVKSEMAGAKH